MIPDFLENIRMKSFLKNRTGLAHSIVADFVALRANRPGFRLLLTIYRLFLLGFVRCALQINNKLLIWCSFLVSNMFYNMWAKSGRKDGNGVWNCSNWRIAQPFFLKVVFMCLLAVCIPMHIYLPARRRFIVFVFQVITWSNLEKAEKMTGSIPIELERALIHYNITSSF